MPLQDVISLQTYFMPGSRFTQAKCVVVGRDEGAGLEEELANEYGEVFWRVVEGAKGEGEEGVAGVLEVGGAAAKGGPAAPVAEKRRVPAPRVVCQGGQRLVAAWGLCVPVP